MHTRREGVIRRWHVDGYGFIQTKKGEPDIYIHPQNGRRLILENGKTTWSDKAAGRAPAVGDVLVYELEQGPKGPRAKFWGFKDDVDNLKKGERRRVA